MASSQSKWLMASALLVLVIVALFFAVRISQREQGFGSFDYTREAPQPLSCGGIAGITCPKAYYCYYPPENEGVADGTGLCLQE